MSVRRFVGAAESLRVQAIQLIGARCLSGSFSPPSEERYRKATLSIIRAHERRRRRFEQGEKLVRHLQTRVSDWVHEIKHDGYCLIVRRDGETVRLFTRRGYDRTDRYPGIASAAAKLR
jgi:ATP-dependent DNA ligase